MSSTHKGPEFKLSILSYAEAPTLIDVVQKAGQHDRRLLVLRAQCKASMEEFQSTIDSAAVKDLL